MGQWMPHAILREGVSRDVPAAMVHHSRVRADIECQLTAQGKERHAWCLKLAPWLDMTDDGGSSVG